MDFFDTQILLHKFSNNKNSLNKSLDADIEKQDITGGQISSVVALEFLSVMEKTVIAQKCTLSNWQSTIRLYLPTIASEEKDVK